MVSLLNAVYSALIILVAVAGIGFVLWLGDVGDGETNRDWQGAVVALAVILYLVAMVGGLVT